MTEHTKEPWFIGGGKLEICSQGRKVCQVTVKLDEVPSVGLPAANAKRIVACVNALEGIPTELLERALKARVPVARPVVLINRESNQILDKEAL
jgi:hypothetical protein